MISHSGSTIVGLTDPISNDPYAELMKFFNGALLLHSECPDVISWWGVCFSILQ